TLIAAEDGNTALRADARPGQRDDASLRFVTNAFPKPLGGPLHLVFPRHPSALPYGSRRSKLAISSAAKAASTPLLPAFVPDRSMACSNVSTVSRPKPTGTPVSRATRFKPADAWAHT